MKKRQIYFNKFDIILILSFAVLFYFLENREQLQNQTLWFRQLLTLGREKYEQSPVPFIALFCSAHLISSVFSLPGSCTILNLLSGAIFGFGLGCAIVYPVTMVSAILVFFIGYWFRDLKVFSKLSVSMEKQFKAMGHRDFAFLVALRLSPLLPFGMVNFICGAVRISFSLYFFSTLLGVFFDVVLLNNVGAAISAAAKSSPVEQRQIYVVFAILFLAMLTLRFLVSRRATDARVS